MMKTFKYLIASVLLGGACASHAGLITIESQFSQHGFAGGGSISGYFRGTDKNGDGQITTVSDFVSNFSDFDVSNELEYAEITFNDLGTTLGNQTLIYDGNIDSPLNFFFGFAYNIGSGFIGDEANEGISFSVFAPSTNYVLGEAFKNLFVGAISGIDPTSFGACDGTNYCSAVLELEPDPADPRRYLTVSQNLSTGLVAVPEPDVLALFCLAILGMYAKSRKCKR